MPDTQEQEKKTFIVVHRDSIEGLEKEVNNKLNDGYILYGDIQCLEKIYTQSMILSDKAAISKIIISGGTLNVTGIDG